MGKALITRRYRTAIRAATASIADLATEAGYSKPGVETYLYYRAPSRRAALALADALESRAERLVDYARKLREAAGDERDTDAASQPRRRRARHRQRDR